MWSACQTSGNMRGAVDVLRSPYHELNGVPLDDGENSAWSSPWESSMESHVYLPQTVIVTGLAGNVAFHSDRRLTALWSLTSVCDNNVPAAGWWFESLRHASIAAPTCIFWSQTASSLQPCVP